MVHVSRFAAEDTRRDAAYRWWPCTESTPPPKPEPGGSVTRRIVFHIGLAKTGTTSFQRFCHAHRGFLRRHGVLYPRRQCGRHRNHSPLVASYIAHRPEDPSVAMRWAPRLEAVQTLTAEIDASDTESALISSEHFSIHFDRSEASQLARDFARFEPEVVIMLRDTHARFFSAYNTHVTAGGALDIEDYARATLIAGTRYMSMRETILIWQTAFGADRIRLIDYDAEPDVTAAILRHCGIDGPLPGTPRVRLSLGADVVEQLRGANAEIRRRQPVPSKRSLAAWLQLTLFSILCRRRLVKSAGLNGNAMSEAARPRWTLSPRTMAALDAIAARDRDWIAATYGLTLRGSGARDHIAVSSAPASLEEREGAMRHARALVDRVGRGLWAPSQGLVTLWDRLAKMRLFS